MMVAIAKYHHRALGGRPGMIRMIEMRMRENSFGRWELFATIWSMEKYATIPLARSRYPLQA